MKNSNNTILKRALDLAIRSAVAPLCKPEDVDSLSHGLSAYYIKKARLELKGQGETSK